MLLRLSGKFWFISANINDNLKKKYLNAIIKSKLFPLYRMVLQKMIIYKGNS